jgi:hypothetical protein
MVVIPVLSFDKNSRSFVDEISAPWQHCLSGHRVLIFKSMQLEKIVTVKSKRNPQKDFAHQQLPSQLWRALSNETPAIHTYSMLNFYI